ncbi:DUF5627 domain-containing protein [Plebeiibacterium sediminum]|uniref:DUF5627 domain-containing protein n=1 Tax=Plebeiibacterium sediminum TaxID=2992112 RepID=A0AAE3M844_9BACT|nr:DUF5627 domain-containing protein [Plebeiobacterium sediminum]MCW3788999.1 DUF5627 domain-containing protein [Plebeiobacterium sediminum]
MRQFRVLLIIAAVFIGLYTTSCDNKDVDFPDFDYSTVYFSYQYPVRTIVLGEDIVDNTLDNEHKCMIYATMGGVYANNKDVEISIQVNDALCNNLLYSNGSPVEAMPQNYYSLAGGSISLDNSMQGGVEVQLTNAFFDDPKALANTYVIPLEMTDVVNADSILSGQAKVDNPVKCNPSDWDVLPKNYVLYCVKFINPYDANYLRRGEDVITEGGETTTVVRSEEWVENDEVISLTSTSLHSVDYPVTVVNTGGNNETCVLTLTFDANNACTISSSTEGFTVTGSGSYVVNGEKNSWGDKDRSAIYLDYTIEMTGKKYVTKDTLVYRDRGVSLETFSPSYNAE